MGGESTTSATATGQCQRGQSDDWQWQSETSFASSADSRSASRPTLGGGTLRGSDRTFKGLPPGLNEWAVHPAHGTKEWQAIEPTGWRVRHTDHAFLTSPRAREILDQEGISIIDYRPLQEA